MSIKVPTHATAERRLAELRAVRAVLIPDRDDPRVLSEILGVEAQIAAAERALLARHLVHEPADRQPPA